MLSVGKDHTSPSAQVSASWRRIEAWLEGHLPAVKASLRPALSGPGSEGPGRRHHECGVDGAYSAVGTVIMTRPYRVSLGTPLSPTDSRIGIDLPSNPEGTTTRAILRSRSSMTTFRGMSVPAG